MAAPYFRVVLVEACEANQPVARPESLSCLVSARHGSSSECGVHFKPNSIDLNDAVESFDFVAKSASLLYSRDAAILLSLKELPKLQLSNPFFGTMSSSMESRKRPNHVCAGRLF